MNSRLSMIRAALASLTLVLLSGAARAAETDVRFADEQALRRGAADFVGAFNQGDAAAIAAMWAPDGEYVDERGQRFVGREAIEGEYSAFFRALPGVTIRLRTDSLRVISDSVAIEDGRSTLSPPLAGSPATCRYTAVHVKAGGQWLLASVRDWRVQSLSTYDRLRDLEWLIGTWSSVEQGTWDTGDVVNIHVEWGANKSSVELAYNIDAGGGDEQASGRQIIAWDPATRRIQSWAFASDGSRSTGIWTKREGGWAIASAAISPDGTRSSSVDTFTRTDENTIIWQSTERVHGGTAVPDSQEFVLRRITGID